MSKNHPILAFGLQFSKAAIAAITMVLISRWLGAERRGELSLVLFAVNLIMIANEYIGGSSLSNLVVKYPLNRLIPFSKLWALVVCSIGTLIYYLVTGNGWFTLYAALIAFPLSWLTIHYNIYQGIAAANARNFLQLLLEIAKLTGIFILVFMAMKLAVNAPEDLTFWGHTWLHNDSILVMFSIATFGVLGISTIILFRKLITSLKGDTRPVLELITTGFWAQSGQLIQFLNYRVNIVLLTALLGSAAFAGVYSNALLIADAIWIFGNSFASIAHMRILQSQNKAFHADITLRYAVVAIVGTSIACALLFCIPNFIFIKIFGSDFESLRKITLLLVPAVLALGASTLFSHYFHATSQFKLLLKANTSALILQAIIAVLLIPSMDISGACIAVDAGFILNLIIVFVQFKKQNPDAHLRGKFRVSAILKTLRNTDADLSPQNPGA